MRTNLVLRKQKGKTKFEILGEKSKGEKLNPKIEIDWGNPIGKEAW